MGAFGFTLGDGTRGRQRHVYPRIAAVIQAHTSTGCAWSHNRTVQRHVQCTHVTCSASGAQWPARDRLAGPATVSKEQMYDCDLCIV